MPEDKAKATFEPPLDPLDFPERLTRVRTLIIAVLDEERSTLWTADVVDGGVDCLEG
jgi:hypothetical protein